MSLKSKVRMAMTAGQGVALGLSDVEAGADPMQLFGRWFEQAKETGMLQPEAMTLATCSAAGTPSARMVLLKGFDSDGFVFYTNYESRKARELDKNPNVTLVLHWSVLERQVRIEGSVQRTSREESSAYFHSRPRGSQLAAWASEQSEPLRNREQLEQRYHEHEERFKGGEIPLPSFWGGYRVAPSMIEFFQGRINRLHDRLTYEREGAVWVRGRLSP